MPISRRRLVAAFAAASLPLDALAQGAEAWRALPFHWSFPQTHGNGRRRIAVFSDPRCPFCRRFEADLAKVGNLTVHLFPLAILGPESVSLSKAVWCSPDRAKAWNDLVQRRIVPRAPSCADPIEALLAWGRDAGIRVTPTWLLEDGQRRVGGQPAENVAQLLAR